MTGLRRIIQNLFLPLLFLSACISSRTNDVPALGKDLFSDPLLSHDRSRSCASCHAPQLAFTNGTQFAIGHQGAVSDRNVPTLINRDGTHAQFWDMRAKSLEEQIGMVLTSSIEMGSSNMKEVAARLNSDEKYRARFKKIFGKPADPENVARALAGYVRTIRSGKAPYDRYLQGEQLALGPAAKRGLQAFTRFRCDACHSGYNFSDEQKRPRCYPATNNLTDFIPPISDDSKKFKTPTLRNLVYTAPYMHNGSLKTLEEVVDFYTPSFQVDEKGEIDKKRDIVVITPEEKRDLVAFLKSLSAPEPFTESNSP